MNKIELAQSAEELEESFEKYKDLPESVAGLYRELTPYIEKSKRGEIDSPLDKSSLPGGYLFNEGELRPYPSIERSYVHFRMQISGGLSKKAERVLEKIKKV